MCAGEDLMPMKWAVRSVAVTQGKVDGPWRWARFSAQTAGGDHEEPSVVGVG